GRRAGEYDVVDIEQIEELSRKLHSHAFAFQLEALQNAQVVTHDRPVAEGIAVERHAGRLESAVGGGAVEVGVSAGAGIDGQAAANAEDAGYFKAPWQVVHRVARELVAGIKIRIAVIELVIEGVHGGLTAGIAL